MHHFSIVPLKAQHLKPPPAFMENRSQLSKRTADRQRCFPRIRFYDDALKQSYCSLQGFLFLRFLWFEE